MLNYFVINIQKIIEKFDINIYKYINIILKMSQLYISSLSGGIAGIFVDLIYFPIETIKTRIQASNS